MAKKTVSKGGREKSSTRTKKGKSTKSKITARDKTTGRFISKKKKPGTSSTGPRGTDK
jgi:hypothetical protein